MGNIKYCRKIKNIFREDNIEPYLDTERKSTAVFELEECIDKKHLVPRASRIEIIVNQIKFMEKKVMVLQLLCFILLAAAYVALRGSLEEKSLYLFGAAASACFSVFMAVACAQEEARGIAEIAGSCFFNNRQLCTLKIILYGAFDILCLWTVMMKIGENADRSLVEIGVYIAVPFLVTGCLQFGILLSGLGRSSIYVMSASGFFMVMLCGMTASYGKVYEKGAMGIWAAALLVSGAVYGGEIIWMLNRMDKGDLLCMN